jgi:hypothetical protein
MRVVEFITQPAVIKRIRQAQGHLEEPLHRLTSAGSIEARWRVELAKWAASGG